MVAKLVMIHITIILWMLMMLIPKAASSSVAKPNCQESCGSLDIPYPFGIGRGCYYKKWFEIDCRGMNGTDQQEATPYLKKINLEVLDIFIDSGYMRVHLPVNGGIDLRGTPFYFSSEYNKLLAIGCDIIAYMTDQDDKDVLAWCVTSACDSNYYWYHRCKSNINENFQTLGHVSAQSVDGKRVSSNCTASAMTDQNLTCGLVFLADQDWERNLELMANRLYPLDPWEVANLELMSYPAFKFWKWKMGYVAVSLVWEFYNETWSSFRGDNTTTLCKFKPHNLYRVNHSFHSNYTFQCSCIDGYHGNPYLPKGCQEEAYSGYDDDRKKFNWKLVVIGVSSAIGGLILVYLIWWLYKVAKKEINKRKKAKYFKRNGGLLLQQQISSNDGTIEKTKVFSSNELEKATDNYNVDRVLGQGGQGTVYKGMLSDGKIIAVKKSKIIDTVSGNSKDFWMGTTFHWVREILAKYLYKTQFFKKYSIAWLPRPNTTLPTQKNFQFLNPPLDTTRVVQFINEVVILSQINHRNVVKLLGCCLETEVPLLVYEFISNGTLFQHIHDPNEDFPLTWDMRLRIAVEIAGALSYMHSAASMPIYHRDIKSTNILLDEKYKARVSDFGTSRSVDVDITHFTTRVQGTFGYLDPEYFQTSQFTEKSDVYSFGVVLVELLAGKKPIFSNTPQEFRGLAPHFLEMMEQNRFLEMIDPQISKEGKIEEMTVVAHLAKMCLNLKGKKRPTMKEVAAQLEGIRMSRDKDVSQGYSGIIESNSIDLAMAYDTSSTTTETWCETSTSSSTDEVTIC